jgi:hypothetical protein
MSTTVYWWFFWAASVIGKARANNVIARMLASRVLFMHFSFGVFE